jgi:hypothetical protein
METLNSQSTDTDGILNKAAMKAEWVRCFNAGDNDTKLEDKIRFAKCLDLRDLTLSNGYEAEQIFVKVSGKKDTLLSGLFAILIFPYVIYSLYKLNASQIVHSIVGYNSSEKEFSLGSKFFFAGVIHGLNRHNSSQV